MEKKWYVVRVQSGQEKKAKVNLLDVISMHKLQEFFGEILIPCQTVVELSKGTRKVREKNFFPSYVFVQMVLNENTWKAVKNTSKVSGFVGGGKPSPVPENEVSRVIEQAAEGAKRAEAKVSFTTGESVSIIDGPFTGFDGVVEEVFEDKMRLKVSVGVFGRSTPVELEFMQVKQVS